MNNIELFKNESFGEIRTIIENEQVLFCAKDVASALGYSNTNKAINDHCKKGKLTPYADKNKGLFELKECFNEKTKWAGTQTLITPKGRETFRLLLL